MAALLVTVLLAMAAFCIPEAYRRDLAGISSGINTRGVSIQVLGNGKDEQVTQATTGAHDTQVATIADNTQAEAIGNGTQAAEEVSWSGMCCKCSFRGKTSGFLWTGLGGEEVVREEVLFAKGKKTCEGVCQDITTYVGPSGHTEIVKLKFIAITKDAHMGKCATKGAFQKLGNMANRYVRTPVFKRVLKNEMIRNIIVPDYDEMKEDEHEDRYCSCLDECLKAFSMKPIGCCNSRPCAGFK